MVALSDMRLKEYLAFEKYSFYRSHHLLEKITLYELA